MSKDYESIKVEKAVYKRAIYLKEVMKEIFKDEGIEGRVTMSTVINYALRELETWIATGISEDKWQTKKEEEES